MNMMNLSKTKKFLLLYLIFITLFFVSIEHSYLKSFINIDEGYSSIVAQITAMVMKPFVSVSYSDTLIYLPNCSLKVQFGCNGLEAIILYFSAILAYPSSFKQKAYGLIIGFVVINLINIVRIVILGYVLMNHKDIFSVMHSYVTQNIMIVFVFFVFIVYLNLISEKNEQQS